MRQVHNREDGIRCSGTTAHGRSPAYDAGDAKLGNISDLAKLRLSSCVTLGLNKLQFLMIRCKLDSRQMRLQKTAEGAHGQCYFFSNDRYEELTLK